jgi:plasmid stabilization system protein ParE
VRISIQPSALRDLREGFRFYEAREDGLGTYFLDSLFSDIDSLQLYAGIHSVHFGRFFRLLSKRFPYAVYYQINGAEIAVRAVLDLRRDPKRIAEKLKGLP